VAELAVMQIASVPGPVSSAWDVVGAGYTRLTQTAPSPTGKPDFSRAVFDRPVRVDV